MVSGLRDTRIVSGEFATWEEADKHLNGIHNRLLNVGEQVVDIQASIKMLNNDMASARNRLYALEAQVKTPSDDDGVSNRLSCLEQRVTRLFEPTIVGAGRDAVTPDTIAVPVETLREWHASLLKADDVLSDERATAGVALAYLSGWVARELAGVRCAMWALLPHEED